MRAHGPDRPQTAQVRAKSSIIQQGGGPLNLLRQERLRLMDAPRESGWYCRLLTVTHDSRSGGGLPFPTQTTPKVALLIPPRLPSDTM